MSALDVKDVKVEYNPVLSVPVRLGPFTDTHDLKFPAWSRPVYAAAAGHMRDEKHRP